LYQILLSDSSYTNFSLGLDDFYIPEWYKLTHKLPASGADMSLHCVQSIQLLSSNYIDRNQIDTVSWTDVYLHQNRTWPIPLVSGFILSTCIFMFFGYIKAKTWRKAVQTNILNQFEATPETKIRDTEWETIRNYFATNYSESDFKLEAVSKEIGITQKRLTLRVKNQLNKSPREYLNELRLKEGARLLTETDLAINKIAFDVGYNSAAHFNRQFKLKYEATPKAYRDLTLDPSNSK
jgi:AraC-like DNA-binding protein